MSTATASRNAMSADMKRQLKAWEDQAKRNRVAHAKVSTRAERLALWAAIIAAVLAIFTGSAWTADLANAGIASSATIQWVAAVAAFLSALIVAVSATADWKQEQAEHKAAQNRWSTVLEDIAAIRMDGDTSKRRERLENDHAKATTDEPNVPPAVWARTDDWLAKHPG